MSRLRDVARVELGGLDYGVNNYATTPAVAMPVTQLPGSNALIIYDPTTFISESITAVQHTIFEAR